VVRNRSVGMVEALYTMNKVSVEFNIQQIFDLDLKTF
jgi:hypothetical protein